MALLVVLLAVGGQTLLKYGVTQVGGFAFSQGKVVEGFQKVFATPYIPLGIALYGIASVVWLEVLSHLPLSVAYPMLALGYALAVVSGAIVFGEVVTVAKIAGVVLIIMGVVLVAR